MDLDRQLHLLIENAPIDGGTRAAIARGVVPILRRLASQMQHLEYFVVKGRDRGWVLTTLSHRTQAEVEKNVVYAFASDRDAKTFQGASDAELEVEAIPVTHILFQMFALDRVDSAIFMETPGNLLEGTEIRRSELQKLVKQQLQKFQRQKNIPPDLA